MPIPVRSSPTIPPTLRARISAPSRNPNGKGLVLTHGAGSNCQAPLLIAVAETSTAAGFTVLRCDLPYRQIAPYGPPGPRRRQPRSRRPEEMRIAAVKKSRNRAGRVYSRRPLLRRTPGQHALRRTAERSESWPPACSCSPIPCILRESPSSSAPSISPPAHSRSLRPRHPRSLRRDRRDRASVEIDSGEDKARDIEGAGHDLGFKGKARQKSTPRNCTRGIQGLLSP